MQILGNYMWQIRTCMHQKRNVHVDPTFNFSMQVKGTAL